MSAITIYEKEILTALYRTLDYLICSDLPGRKEIEAAIASIEVKTKECPVDTAANYEPVSSTSSQPDVVPTAVPFEVGKKYYGSLSCAHSSFPVICVKRTEKSVWFEHVDLPHMYPKARAKAHSCGDGIEMANFHGWSVWSSSIKDNGWDMMMA